MGMENKPVAAAVTEREMMSIRERRSRHMAPRDRVKRPPTLLEDTLEELLEDKPVTPVAPPLMEEESLEDRPVTPAAAPLMEELLEESLVESLEESAEEQLNILMFSNLLTPEAAIINFA